MSNLETLLAAGAESVAGSVILNNVEVGVFADGEFQVSQEGLEQLEQLEQLAGATPTATDEPVAPTKPAAKKSSKKAAPAPALVVPDVDTTVDAESQSLEDLLD